MQHDNNKPTYKYTSCLHMLSPFIDSFVDDNTSKFGNIFPRKNQSFPQKYRQYFLISLYNIVFCFGERKDIK